MDKQTRTIGQAFQQKINFCTYPMKIASQDTPPALRHLPHDHSLVTILAPGETHGTKNMLVTPELAREWVSNLNYEHQRSLNLRNVTKLRFAIEAGTFRPYSDVHFVLFDGSVHLINGQHTLHAISGSTAQPLCVHVYRAETTSAIENLYNTFDVGRRRSLNDVIHSLEDDLGLTVHQREALGSAVKRIHVRFQQGWKIASAPRESYEIDDNSAMIAQMYKWADEARAYFAMIDEAPKGNRQFFFRADIVAIALITLREQPAAAGRFWGMSAVDDGLKNGDPRKALINWLRQNGVESKRAEQHLAAIACWNAFLEDRRLAKVYPNTKGALEIKGTQFRCDA